MLIVDAQIHIWQAPTPEHPFTPDGRPHRPGAFTDNDAIKELDAAGVNRAVVVTPSWQGEYNEVTLAAARAHPDRFAVMGRFDPHAPGVRGQVAGWLKQRGMLGMRCTFKIAGDGSDDWLWADAEKYGVPIMGSTSQLDEIDRVARQHPALKITLDPPMLNDKKDEAAFRDLDKLLALAKHPNVSVKAKSMPSFSSEPYPYRKMHAIVRRMYDAYGPKRVFWATDLTKLPCTYRQSVTMMTEEISWLTADDKAWLMGRGVCEWTGWKI
jgi:predicted TIM-barrel fold metal-dependent hydrolase